MRAVRVDIGLNTCCYTRRWEAPKHWISLSKEAGYDYVQIDSDALDPFFSGDKKYQRRTAEELKSEADQYKVTITGYYTGMASYRFHGLSHSDAAVRERMKQWVIEAMDLTLAMGAKKVGGRVDAYSVETLSDKQAYEKQVKDTIASYRELSRLALKKGLEALEVEQMYVPSLAPYTLEQTKWYLEQMNKDNQGCHLGVTVDIGHCASQNYGGSGKELLYEEWLRCFGAVCEEIHIQQTRRTSSAHWPFTEKYNAMGDIEVEHIIEALRWSHEHCTELRWSRYLKPVEKNILILEYLPSTTETEDEIIQNIGESARYLRRYIPKGGILL